MSAAVTLTAVAMVHVTMVHATMTFAMVHIGMTVAMMLLVHGLHHFAASFGARALFIGQARHNRVMVFAGFMTRHHRFMHFHASGSVRIAVRGVMAVLVGNGRAAGQKEDSASEYKGEICHYRNS
ncbi:hypothetical protein [Hyphobacterium sp.]|uniref:hypothetical protein n=1 Tax=Hyphobacterium sp. TaxID=2004662 RepID=UPI003B527727